MTRPIKKVAIIGAGPTGLAQLKNLLEVSKLPNARYELQVKVYESKPDVGGVWYSTDEKKHYKKNVVRDEKGKGKEEMYIYPPGEEEPSPMYEGLRTNLPHELMAFRDFPFPTKTPLFPDRRMIHKYFQDYATRFNLWPHISFNTRVERLYQRNDHIWVIETRRGGAEEFDHVCVGNGHYEDGWIPDVPGLSNFQGEILHSIYYLRPADYISRTVLVVGSFASGSDLARQLASLNLDKYEPNSDKEGYTKVYVSCSTPPDTIDPWTPYITYLPLMDHIQEDGTIVLQDQRTVKRVDTIIFATGYNFSLPFCKFTDYPWSDPEYQVLGGAIHTEEREGGREGEVGGMKGLSMDKLDQVMLFLEADEGKSIAFPALQYQIVPFPLVETQTRLIALLWSGSLTLPDNIKLPPNPSNPYHSTSPPTHSTDSDPVEKQDKPRKTIQLRKKLVFGATYEFTYQEYLISLIEGVDDPDWIRNWWSKQDIKKGWRADTTLRKRTLGY